MNKANRYLLLVTFFTIVIFSFCQTSSFACSCNSGSGGTIVGIEYVTCQINAEDDDVVTYTIHYNIGCSGTSFYKPYNYSNEPR